MHLRERCRRLRHRSDNSADFNFFQEKFQVQLALAIRASDHDASEDPHQRLSRSRVWVVSYAADETIVEYLSASTSSAPERVCLGSGKTGKEHHYRSTISCKTIRKVNVIDNGGRAEQGSHSHCLKVQTERHYPHGLVQLQPAALRHPGTVYGKFGNRIRLRFANPSLRRRMNATTPPNEGKRKSTL